VAYILDADDTDVFVEENPFEENTAEWAQWNMLDCAGSSDELDVMCCKFGDLDE
jgi:hypothetical protein